MNVDKWFEKQSKVVQIILIVLPLVGWVMEILIRVSAYIRKQNTTDLILLIVYLLLGWTWIPLIVDVVFLATKGHLFMAEDFKEVVDGDSQESVDAQEKKEDKEEKEEK